jgi:hypothetical protein
VLHRVAEPVQGPDARVAAPGEDQLADAAGADHLVVDEVGGHPRDGEVAPALPDDLVAGGHRDEVGEALQRDQVAVADELRDALGQGEEVGHAAPTFVRNANGCIETTP